MSSNYINIGPTPPEEDCIQIGKPGARAETEIYRRQLEREFPEGNFGVKAFRHEFGTYHEVVAYCYTPEETEAAYAAEGEGAALWDEIARAEHDALMESLK